jgi:hypothetical protein
VKKPTAPEIAERTEEATPAEQPPAAPAPAPERKPVEKLLAEKKTPAWLFAAARVHKRWPVGLELTEAEYEEGIKEAAGLRVG